MEVLQIYKSQNFNLPNFSSKKLQQRQIKMRWKWHHLPLPTTSNRFRPKFAFKNFKNQKLHNQKSEIKIQKIIRLHLNSFEEPSSSNSREQCSFSSIARTRVLARTLENARSARSVTLPTSCSLLAFEKIRSLVFILYGLWLAYLLIFI